ncbi:MAG TPA: PDZ domain-containing protein, partial [Tepidisphaeraceae bacterium]
AFKANFAHDPTGRATLEQVTGRSLHDFERDWQAWMVKRTPPAFNTGPDGPFLGVQFAQGNDGLKIELVVTRGPADTAGIKVGDVVVGLNDLDVRDQQSLMPLLKEFKPGDSVVLKLRRGETYLELPLTLGKRGESRAVTRPTTRVNGATPRR